MPEIKSYEDMDVEILRSTVYPAELVALAIQITMKSDPEEDIPVFTQKKAKFLWDAEHQSLFEHVGYTFLIQNVSRSFLAQITRQRTASPTSGSQHYQDYSDYPAIVSPEVIEDPILFQLHEVSLGSSFGDYHYMIEQLGVPPEEARQILPNAAATNYLWTIDALNLAKFLRTRLCHRNVLEMRIFSEKILSLVKEHFPELFNIIGPQCYMDKCKQGFLACEMGKWQMPRT